MLFDELQYCFVSFLYIHVFYKALTTIASQQIRMLPLHLIYMDPFLYIISTIIIIEQHDLPPYLRTKLK